MRACRTYRPFQWAALTDPQVDLDQLGLVHGVEPPNFNFGEDHRIAYDSEMLKCDPHRASAQAPVDRLAPSRWGA